MLALMLHTGYMFKFINNNIMKRSLLISLLGMLAVSIANAHQFGPGPRPQVNVPDSSATLVLLGLGVASIVAAKRVFGRRS